MRQAAAAEPVGSTGWAVRAALVAAGRDRTWCTSSRPCPGCARRPRSSRWWTAGSRGPPSSSPRWWRRCAWSSPRSTGCSGAWSRPRWRLRAFGYITYFADIRTRVPQPYPSLADAGWLASSVVLLAALTALVRPRARQFSLPLVLDAVIAALTAGGRRGRPALGDPGRAPGPRSVHLGGHRQPRLPAPRRRPAGALRRLPHPGALAADAHASSPWWSASSASPSSTRCSSTRSRPARSGPPPSSRHSTCWRPWSSRTPGGSTSAPATPPPRRTTPSR